MQSKVRFRDRPCGCGGSGEIPEDKKQVTVCQKFLSNAYSIVSIWWHPVRLTGVHVRMRKFLFKPVGTNSDKISLGIMASDMNEIIL